MRPIISNIFCNQFLNCVRNPFGIVSSFMQTMSDLIHPGSLKIFMSRILWESHLIHLTLLTEHRHIFSIRICEVLSDETFRSFGISTSSRNSQTFQKSLWMPHSGTGWIDWFESPHTKVITIHKVNPDLFIYLFIYLFILFDLTHEKRY
jgi:hypothetical protein